MSLQSPEGSSGAVGYASKVAYSQGDMLTLATGKWP